MPIRILIPVTNHIYTQDSTPAGGPQHTYTSRNMDFRQREKLQPPSRSHAKSAPPHSLFARFGGNTTSHPVKKRWIRNKRSRVHPAYPTGFSKGVGRDRNQKVVRKQHRAVESATEFQRSHLASGSFSHANDQRSQPTNHLEPIEKQKWWWPKVRGPTPRRFRTKDERLAHLMG